MNKVSANIRRQAQARVHGERRRGHADGARRQEDRPDLGRH